MPVHRIVAYGVRLALDVETAGDADLRPPPAVAAVLPPGWAVDDDPASAPVAHFALTTDATGLTVGEDGVPVATGLEEAVALGLLEARMRAAVALHAPGRVFVHAGAVALGDRALVLPGSSFAGKTTLVAALLRAGAAYLSDEHAVLDADGRVHPYAKPLSLRAPGAVAQTKERDARELGAVADAPDGLRVGLVAICRFVPGTTFAPVEVSAGAGALALLGHTVCARTRPVEALGALRRVAEGARVLEGPRGEADAAAEQLLELLHIAP